MDREARRAAVHGVAKSWTRLSKLNSKPIGLPTTKVPEGSRSSDFLWVCTIPHPTKLELAIATVYYLSN